ncbi:hemolysin D [Pokkaliibacter plantistimulans]|uniref:Hemolysin D n=1 Tax=Proteobacteria bacterium 228 TaxID=2083153 RepID=A0A2S5KPL5_9PROT|nr:HlyD family secretion protein [Pokkaliibacter plantistimulans]PPC76784.1 hemolysin D [Pokkaliibacter plantistimulans]
MNQVVTPPPSATDPVAGNLTTPVRKNGRKRVMVLALAAGIVATAGYAGQHWWQVGRFVETTDDAYVGGENVVLASRVAGFISALEVTDNQHVQAGQVLLRIDDRPLRISLEGAEADIAKEEAALLQLQAEQARQQAEVDAAAPRIDAARARLLLAGQDNKRYRALASSSAASVQDAQRAVASLATAKAEQEQAEAALMAARRQLDVLSAQRRQLQAARDAAVAERDKIQLDLSYTLIRAPIDGVVGNRAARLGGYTTVGSRLLTIVPRTRLWVDANYKEDQLHAMQAGQAVSLTVDALPGHTLRGHILSIAPATGSQFSLLPAENATGNFTKIVQRVPVRISIDEHAELLRPGMSVTAAVDTRELQVETLAQLSPLPTTVPGAGQ